MKKFLFLIMVLLPAAFSVYGQSAEIDAFESSEFIDPDKFAEPPRGYRQYAWLTYNLSRATEENMEEQVRRWAEADLTGGFYLGMGGGNTSVLSEEYMQGAGIKPSSEGVAFLSPEYFKIYAKAIESGLKYGNPPIVFYDEVGYPSGMAGGLLYSKYPQHGAKSLEMLEKDVSGPANVQLEVPENGITLGAVRMDLETKELVDISNRIKASRNLEAKVPKGRFKVMLFYLDPKASLGQGRKSGYVDYLDEEAVKTFIDMVYQSHYDNLKQYFGTVLKITHYDEPALHVTRGRAWTPRYNEKFSEQYGFDPMKYYPALFYDIGPSTAAVRNLLWGFRTRLFSENYIKQMDDWCREHDIMLSGHLDQEEITNPVPVNGDMMLMFKHQQVPAIDDIWWWGRENRSYKIVSSSAYNWDKPFVMAETYAGWRGPMDQQMVYRIAMDQAAMGTNFQVGALPRFKTPESDRFIGRLSYMLQHGRHVADVAILYPIASLQAAYSFGNWSPETGGSGGMVTGYAREGGYNPPETDYIELGEIIYRGLRQDFTFLHPEVLEGKTVIDRKQLILDNRVNRENYSVLIIPGSRVLSVKTVSKIKAFYEAGGTVIATRILADKSAEEGRDEEVKKTMEEIFGMYSDKPLTAEFQRRVDEFMVHFINRNQTGGRAYFLPDYTPEMLQAVMKEVIPVWDVNIEEPMWPVNIGPSYNGSLTYNHKVKQDRSIYFFANSSDKTVDTHVVLRGSVDVSLWDPMTGKTEPAAEEHSKSKDGQSITRIPLRLQAATAIFYVEEPR
jgi:hypothetical protein